MIKIWIISFLCFCTVEEEEEAKDETGHSHTDSSDGKDSEASDDEEQLCQPEKAEQLYPLLPKHLRCSSHTSNLVATTDAQKAINSSKKLKKTHSEALSRCNVLWKLMGSPKQKEKVIKILGHTLRRPTVVRWNSCYDAVVQLTSEEKEILSMVEQLSIKNTVRPVDMRYSFDFCTIMN